MGRKEKNKLFGTDGIRGKTGTFPLDRETLKKIGYCLTRIMPENSRILVGRDSRESGQGIINLITQKTSKANSYFDCGIIPSPGLSYLTKNSGMTLGIMVSASHNPYYDNGLKFFNNAGEKLSSRQEDKIEKSFYQLKETSFLPASADFFKNTSIYQDFLLNTGEILKGEKLKLVIDCANGATYKIAPRVFKALGFQPIFINCSPNGRNINQQCGSENTAGLIKTVLKEKADLGIAFDGDGDRVIFADKSGKILDGDHILFLLTKYFQLTGEVHPDEKIIGTVMSNLGLEKKIKEMGYDFIRSDVGDKKVYQKMQENDSILGGEPSGHIILSNYHNTGDGILTAILFIKAMIELNINNTDPFKQLDLFPQLTSSIPVKEKIRIEEWPELDNKIVDFNNQYKKNSRILIRYSGTEPKIRIMIESEDPSIINKNIKIFQNLIENKIGVK